MPYTGVWHGPEPEDHQTDKENSETRKQDMLAIPQKMRERAVIV